MDIRSGTLEAIGNTPLIQLSRASEKTGCTILGKAEFMNPGGRSRTAPRLASYRRDARRGSYGRAGASSTAPRATPASG